MIATQQATKSKKTKTQRVRYDLVQLRAQQSAIRVEMQIETDKDKRTALVEHYNRLQLSIDILNWN